MSIGIWCHNWEDATTSIGERPGRLLSTLQCPGQPHNRELSAQLPAVPRPGSPVLGGLSVPLVPSRCGERAIRQGERTTTQKCIYAVSQTTKKAHKESLVTASSPWMASLFPFTVPSCLQILFPFYYDKRQTIAIASTPFFFAVAFDLCLPPFPYPLTIFPPPLKGLVLCENRKQGQGCINN